MKIRNPKLKNFKGFTLLELMVALAIMALSLVALFQAQTRSMRMAEKARSITIATELARKKLLDCKNDMLKGGFSTSNYDTNGSFAEDGFENFTWECHAYQFDMPPPNADSISKGIQAQSKGMPDLASGKGGADMSANMLAPFFALISTTLGASLKEMTLIIRWQDNGSDEALKVVTHVVDRTAMAMLAAQLPDNPMGMPGMPGVQPSSAAPPTGTPPMKVEP